MITESLNYYVTLSLHWTERVKALSGHERRVVLAEQNELFYYSRATASLYMLYQEMTGPAYSGDPAQVAELLAYNVECMIYRIKEIAQFGSPRRKKLCSELLRLLTKVSDHLLPLATPGVTQITEPPQDEQRPPNQQGYRTGGY